MAIRTKEELINNIKTLIGENDSDEALGLLEDVSDTFADFETTPLFVLEKNTTRAVTVRIWLEGEDPNCEDDIADSGLDLLLQFSAKDIK